MDLASGQYVDDEVPLPEQPTPPWLLVLWFQCNEYHALPHQGGICDQSVLLLQSMQAAGQAYRDNESAQLKIQEALAHASR